MAHILLPPGYATDQSGTTLVSQASPPYEKNREGVWTNGFIARVAKECNWLCNDCTSGVRFLECHAKYLLLRKL